MLGACSAKTMCPGADPESSALHAFESLEEDTRVTVELSRRGADPGDWIVGGFSLEALICMLASFGRGDG